MTSQPGYQTITIHMLPNISRKIGNQTMKFGRLIECKNRNIFLQNETGRLVPHLLLFYKESLYKVKASGL